MDNVQSERLKFASLFSGCGGFDLGFIQGGYCPVGAYDNDRDAVENFKANVAADIYMADLTHGIPAEDSIRGIDVLIAGPPCQGFSTAGKRVIDDERNHLLTLTGHLARRVSPKVLVVENVAGALSGAHARYWNELDTMMRDAGYRTKTLRCQAADLGMAQLRKRILLFAWRTGREIDFATPTRAPSNLRAALALSEMQANHNPHRLRRETREWLIAKRIKPGQKLSNVRGGDNAVATWD
jgi:DNA (cytosine-5)-methyltransferase 1